VSSILNASCSKAQQTDATKRLCPRLMVSNVLLLHHLLGVAFGMISTPIFTELKSPPASTLSVLEKQNLFCKFLLIYLLSTEI